MTRSWSATSRLEAVDGNTTKQTQSRRTAVKSTASNDEPRTADLAFEIRGLCCVKASDSFVAHALSVPRRDSSRRPAQFGHSSSTNAPNTTKQTQSRRTPLVSGPDCQSANDRAAGGEQAVGWWVSQPLPRAARTRFSFQRSNGFLARGGGRLRKLPNKANLHISQINTMTYGKVPMANKRDRKKRDQ